MARETPPPSWQVPLRVSMFCLGILPLVFLSSHLRPATLGEDAHVLERLGCGSRLSNISAIMEMFGEQVFRVYAFVFIDIILHIYAKSALAGQSRIPSSPMSIVCRSPSLSTPILSSSSPSSSSLLSSSSSSSSTSSSSSSMATVYSVP